MRAFNVSEVREKLADLLTAVENGEEIIIMRRDRPVARITAISQSITPFPDRSQLRQTVPPMQASAAQTVRELRDAERY